VISVVKLGGSLLSASTLPACLAQAMTMPGRVVIVAGGGVFADLVRSEQLRWQFDNVAAHRMAILAMQQMAVLCQRLQPALTAFNHVADFSDSAEKSIWMPDWGELDQAKVHASWDITSDSLAAWLASRLNAARLLLIKAGDVDQSASLAQLQQQGLLDPAFSDFAEPQRVAISVINQQRFLSASCSN
jgi:aspartokinase-like uncharacterized kinase